MKSYKFIISGKVQGVYYRVNVQKNASNSNFSGYVKNLTSGDVEACVTCEDERLEEFKNILKTGSPNSVVTALRRSNSNEVFSGVFEIR